MTRHRVWQSFDDSEEGQSSLAQARIYLLNLLATSMASAWQYLVRGRKPSLSPCVCVPSKAAALGRRDLASRHHFTLSTYTRVRPPTTHRRRRSSAS